MDAFLIEDSPLSGEYRNNGMKVIKNDVCEDIVIC